MKVAARYVQIGDTVVCRNNITVRVGWVARGFYIYIFDEQDDRKKWSLGKDELVSIKGMTESELVVRILAQH